jgi:hypothetical protein
MQRSESDQEIIINLSSSPNNQFKLFAFVKKDVKLPKTDGVIVKDYRGSLKVPTICIEGTGGHLARYLCRNVGIYDYGIATKLYLVDPVGEESKTGMTV